MGSKNFLRAALSLLNLVPVAGFATAQNPNPSQDIPARFRGDWDSKMEDCGVGDNESALSVDARWIQFYESSGPVLAVIPNGNTLSLIARLSSDENGGETWDSVIQFKLTATDAVLEDITDPGLSRMVRYKCPHHIPHTAR